MEGEVKGIDFKSGVMRFRGKEDRYLSVLRKFADGLQDEDQTFEDAVLPENLAETKNKIHALKGVAGNLAVSDVYTISEKFEMTLKEGAPSRELYEALCVACRQAKKVILELTNASSPVKTVIKGNAEQCVTLLKELRAAAETYDVGACNAVVNKLRERIWENIDGESIKKITALAEDYEFDDAVVSIDAMLIEINK